MSRNRIFRTSRGEEFTYRVERKYQPAFTGECLLYLFRPEDGSPRFTVMLCIPGSLVPKLGPEFDRLGESGFPYVARLVEEGRRRDLQITLRPDAEPELAEVQGLRKFPMPGADGGPAGSWG